MGHGGEPQTDYGAIFSYYIGEMVPITVLHLVPIQRYQQISSPSPIGKHR